MPRKARNKEFTLVTVAAVGTARVQLVGMALSIAEKQGANACVCSTPCALAAPDLITVMLCVPCALQTARATILQPPSPPRLKSPRTVE